MPYLLLALSVELAAAKSSVGKLTPWRLWELHLTAVLRAVNSMLVNEAMYVIRDFKISC